MRHRVNHFISNNYISSRLRISLKNVALLNLVVIVKQNITAPLPRTAIRKIVSADENVDRKLKNPTTEKITRSPARRDDGRWIINGV